MKKWNLKGINAETITGVLILLLALINSVLRMCGIDTLPFTNEEIGNVVSGVFVIGASLYNTYKNRNISTASQIAQQITDAIKRGELVADDVEGMINKIKK